MAFFDIRMNSLRTIEAVARLGSYSAAARDLDYTEPGLYQQVRTLERTLGVKVFERATRGMQLTPGGARILPSACDVIDTVETLHETVNQVRRNDTVFIAVKHNTGRMLLGRLTETFTRATGYRVRVAHLPDAQIVDRVAAGTHDLGLGGALDHYLTPSERRASSLRLIRWATGRVAVVATPTVRRQPRLDQLLFIPSYLAAWYEENREAEPVLAGLRPVYTDSLDQALLEVFRERGLGAFPRWGVASDITGGRLVTVGSLRPESASRPIFMVRRARIPRDGPVDAFIRHVAETRRIAKRRRL